MSKWDEPRNYYVYKYVYDPVAEDYTELEGEIQGFTKATNSFDACKNLDMDDPNKYGAREIEDLEKFTKAIKDERNHLKRISKQLKEMTDEVEAERKKFLEERPCPNGCGQMDKAMRCPKCGFGHEGKGLIKDIDKLIADEKKNGNDTTELESIKEAIEEQTKLEDELAEGDAIVDPEM